MYKVQVQDFHFQAENASTLNGAEVKADLLPLGDNRFHILMDDKSYTAEIISSDFQTKTFKVKINGKICEVSARDKFDMLLEQMGLAGAGASKPNDLKAPMPGLILNVVAQEGASVKKGDIILILEAMKMENVLKATADAVVKKIRVKKGESVSKGEIMVEFQ